MISAISIFFSYVHPYDSRLYSRREKKKSRGASEETRRDNVRYRDRACTFQWCTSRALCRIVAAAYSRLVFDKFAEFYGSIYGNATGRCSSCQITRIPWSLIGRSYAEERRGTPSNATPVGNTPRSAVTTTSNYVFLSPRGYDDTSTTLISSLLPLLSIIKKKAGANAADQKKPATISALNNFLCVSVVQYAIF